MSLKQPVRYPVKYYSHLDAGAPQLADADGVIKTILKACLVTGYGTGADEKSGAGWTALFDDATRIVLRRPLRTGNPPDIKIENGVINGTASHRIVSQDDPTGLDDTSELASVNLLARDSKKGVEWHLIVSDFAFVLCYQMGYSATGDRNHIVYVGGIQKTINSSSEVFIATSSTRINRDGKAESLIFELLRDDSGIVKNMRSSINYSKTVFSNYEYGEGYFNNDYTAQSIMIDLIGFYPFWCSFFSRYNSVETSEILIDGRPALRYVNAHVQKRLPKVFYIPLDYWEL